MTTRRLRFLRLVLLTTLVGCDFATKQAARTSLREAGAMQISVTLGALLLGLHMLRRARAAPA